MGYEIPRAESLQPKLEARSRRCALMRRLGLHREHWSAGGAGCLQEPEHPDPPCACWGAGEHPESVRVGSTPASPPSTRITPLWHEHVLNGKTGLGVAVPERQAPALLASISIPWQTSKGSAPSSQAPRKTVGSTAFAAALVLLRRNTRRFRGRRMSPRLTPPQDRAIPLQKSGAAAGEMQIRRFDPYLSSSRSLGADSAFRLQFRAGILLWAHPQPTAKWNKNTRRKRLASPLAWTRSGVCVCVPSQLTLGWLRKTKSHSGVSDRTHKWELANVAAAHRRFLLEDGDSDLSTPAVHTIYIPLKDSEEEISGLCCIRLPPDPFSSSDGAREALFYAITHKDFSRHCQTLRYDQVFHNLSYFPFKPQLSVACGYTRTSAFIKE